MQRSEYPIVETNLHPRPASGKTSLLEAATQVLAADSRDGRIHFDENLIIQVPPPLEAHYSIFFHGVLSRGTRPQHPSSCPLCLDVVRLSGQHYIALDLPEWPILILANPYPYLPECVTWAVGDHLAQHCGDASPNATWHHVFLTMLLLCEELSGHVVCFNEVVGNSLDHLHLVSHCPPSGHGPYAPQQLAARLGLNTGVAHLGPHNGYPTDVWRISSPNPAALAGAAIALLAQWQQIGGPSASANCAATMENGLPALYIFPRSKLLSAWGWATKPAILEMLGVFIATSPWAVERVRRGHWGHSHFLQVLSSLRPPSAGDVDCGVEL
jgi:hypothetical protein